MTGPSWQDGRIWHKRQQLKRRTIRVVGFAILLRMTSQKMGSIIEVDRLSKRFGKTDVLRSLSFSVSAKEVVSVIGPSGSGKTTLLRCLAMLESPTEGEIRLRGVPHTVELRRKARAVRADIGMVFQHFNLWPHKTVLGNIIEAPMLVKGLSRAEAVAGAERLLAKVGLSEKRDVYPARLSGGQQQRVAIARAIRKSCCSTSRPRRLIRSCAMKFLE